MSAGASSQPEIRLVELTKQYGEVCAVDHVSLEIAAGEFFSLLGPSGCGKTTTLRMIGGFEAPTSGRVELNGRDVSRDPPERRPVNMVFQSYALFPHLNLFDNVAFGLRRRKVEAGEISRRVGAVLDLVRLTGMDRRRVDQLSGGQQQRVALARALVCEPTVLLLDEPLGALDLKLRKQLQVELKRIQAEVGITFVYVTHDQEEALTLSNRIAVMRAGRVEQLGTPEELYERPQTRFVADFIGTTNLLPGVVEQADDGTSVVRLAAGGRCRVRAASLGPGRAVDVSVRPEAIVLQAIEEANLSGPAAMPSIPSADVAAGPAAGADGPCVRGRIEQSAYLGTSISYLVRTESGQPIAVVTSRAAGRLATGTAVAAHWDIDDALVLERSEAAEEARQ